MSLTWFIYVKRIDDHRVYNEEFISLEICESCLSNTKNSLKNMIIIFTFADKLVKDQDAKSIATTILNLYNAQVKEGNRIDKYVIYDNQNPEVAVNQIIELLTSIENKIHISNNFLMEMATKILKD